MIIKLFPVRSDETLTIHREGDAITINGEVLDFGPIPDDATLPKSAIDCYWIADNVTRANGQLTVPVVFPYGEDATDAVKYPEPIELTSNGDVPLPRNGGEYL